MTSPWTWQSIPAVVSTFQALSQCTVIIISEEASRTSKRGLCESSAKIWSASLICRNMLEVSAYERATFIRGIFSALMSELMRINSRLHALQSASQTFAPRPINELFRRGGHMHYRELCRYTYLILV